MDARRWQRVNELFEAAVARPAEERAAFVAEVCAGDEELARQLRRLVRAHERSRGFLETPVVTRALRIVGAPNESPGIEPPLTAFRAGADFRGTGRFTVRRQLGAGGMGVVYEVHDRARDEIVALKTLLRARPADIFRLKREFRSLADVAHPNLVSLYELVVEDADCFFTMELVDGVNFVEHIRGSASAAARVDFEQVRRAFRQLVEGIAALHDSGKLHRDIKPSNVLITPAGRVVILDFGLASDVAPDDAASGGSMAGTPAYVAPDRHAGGAPSEGHDWYSVGVTLYEALTGRLPFEGRFDVMRRRQQESDPPVPAEIAPGTPDDLSAICMGLLHRDPGRRLSGREASRMLERDSADAAASSPSVMEVEQQFVGRRRQLDALEAALMEAKQGRATTVYIHGPSGIGKSALVQHFLDRVLAREDIVVLRGRCYERESVPYKALDGVIDSLSEHLRALPRSQAERLLPGDGAALFRLFPVMLQVAAAAPAAGRALEHADPIVLRRQAFDALRHLLTRMASRQPLVVSIDDLHWADADSAALLDELLRPPHAPPILTIVSFRAEEVASKPFLQALLDRAHANAGIGLPLEPMPDDEARTLLTSAIGGEVPVGEAEIARLVDDTGGNPFLLRHLAGYLATHRLGSDRPTFAQMLDERLHALPRGAQRFLETLAICGRAMAPEVVHEAAGLGGDERPLVARLRADHFLRASGSASRVELYHDRIRETLAASVSTDDRRTLHGLLARTLVARGAEDPEALCEHYREAGETELASAQAALAATKADAALAFDRAAAYYRDALELATPPRAHPEWKERLAAALANAGRPAEAADAYLDAAGEAHPARRVELQRVAAEQLLIGGHIDRGLEVIRTVLRAVRLRLARGPRGALASLLWRRLTIWWRGLSFVERDADRVPPADLLRIDTCWSVATGFVMVDHLHAADFQAKHLLLALDAGEPYRIARALAAEVFYFGAAGGPHRHLAIEAVSRAEAMAARVGHPHATALCALVRSAAAFLVGDWPATQTYSERALGIMRDQYVATLWELNSAQVFRVSALVIQGKLREASAEMPALLAAARERGNLYFETELRTRMNVVWLAADEPDEGEREADEAMRQWSHAGFHRQHYCYMLDRVQTELYRGRARAAWQEIAGHWKSLERSYLLRIQFQRLEAWSLRARCALLVAATEGNAHRFLAIARNDARRIAREKMPWSDPLAHLLIAAVAHLERQTHVACDRLAEAAAGFERAHMGLHAAVARRLRAELTSGDASRAMRRQADEWMEAQGIVNPARITRLIAPGFPDEREAT